MLDNRTITDLDRELSNQSFGELLGAVQLNAIFKSSIMINRTAAIESGATKTWNDLVKKGEVPSKEVRKFEKPVAGDAQSAGFPKGTGKFKGVEVVAPKNQLTELDDIDLKSKTIFEDKNASGLYMENPTVPQTEQQWAKKQIYNKTVNRIDTIQNAESTRPTTNGSQSVPSVSDIQNIITMFLG
ncbi:hypothetical protein [Paenibacillus hamazuiensis]|uniref:hypothetical protein n=1 Tax=Paenibacillus hamazuiensis TaxID=2936508 RepID=UPI00200C85A6|nr:hypothetical protein [Paenibacillus hamazuiensis]